MIFRIAAIAIDPHFGRLLVSDEGDLLWPGDKDNTRATRYIDRVM